MTFLIFRSILYAAGFIWLWIWLATPLRHFDEGLSTMPAWANPAGWSALAAGAVLALWCIATFIVRGRGTPAIFDAPRRLVAAGPYRYVRNPMYIGAGLAVIGAAIVYHSWALAVYVLVLAVLLNLLISSYEEPTLTRMFGAEYEAYKAAVPRWIPRWP